MFNYLGFFFAVNVKMCFCSNELDTLGKIQPETLIIFYFGVNKSLYLSFLFNYILEKKGKLFYFHSCQIIF